MQSNHPSTGTKFPLGQTVATRGALAELTAEDIRVALGRHCRGDWGDLGAGDKALNDQALTREDRIVSAYHSAAGIKFFILTEVDRSLTILLLPDEY